MAESQWTIEQPHKVQIQIDQKPYESPNPSTGVPKRRKCVTHMEGISVSAAGRCPTSQAARRGQRDRSGRP
jgi:hypothetical protein